LIEKADVDRMLDDAQPDMVIHLAPWLAHCHNQKNPGKFSTTFDDGGPSSSNSRGYAALRNFVATGTVCAYPKFTNVPFKEDDLWNGYPEETNAPYGLAKKMMLVHLSLIANSMVSIRSSCCRQIFTGRVIT